MSCQCLLEVSSQAEDSPLTGNKLLTKLALSVRVKPVTDPNSDTVVGAYQFLITT